MTTLMPNAKQQFFSANGAPLAGGSVYFYIPGTTTFKTTWQDSSQIAANTNPVILDSAGEAVIFGSGVYRQVVFDSLGNQIWDQLTSSTDATGVALGGALQGFIGGLTLSNNGNTSINVSAGTCTDDTNSFLIGLLAGTINCAVVGKNGLDVGTLANSTWYHVFAISQPAGFTPALLASLSATAPALPSSYTLKRRIGSFKTDGSAHILGFVQVGDEFIATLPTAELASGSAGLTPTILQLSGVPAGVKVNALLRAAGVHASNFGVLLQAADESAVSPPNSPPGNLSLSGVAGSVVAGQFNLRTSTTGQIRYVCAAATTTLNIISYGWIDSRGQFV